MGDSQEPQRRGFIVSFTGADLAAGRWIAWELEAVGYTTVFQGWDFQGWRELPAGDAPRRARDRPPVAVLSARYVDALYTQPEWAAALVSDPAGRKRQLLSVRIEEEAGRLRHAAYRGVA
jgi:hypothetical protein